MTQVSSRATTHTPASRSSCPTSKGPLSKISTRSDPLRLLACLHAVVLSLSAKLMNDKQVIGVNPALEAKVRHGESLIFQMHEKVSHSCFS